MAGPLSLRRWTLEDSGEDWRIIALAVRGPVYLHSVVCSIPIYTSVFLAEQAVVVVFKRSILYDIHVHKA